MAIDFRKELNDEQYRVVAHADGPSLVLAGAGSGKTRTITYRVAHLLERGVSPENILLVTFTNKAAREMIERVSSLTKNSYGDGAHIPWAGTFHHLGAKALRHYGSRAGIHQGFTILDEEDAKAILSHAMREEGVSPKVQRFPSPGALRSIISLSRNTLTALDDIVQERYAHWTPITSFIEAVAARYEGRKRAANVMDFDDLLSEWLRLLSSNRALAKEFSSLFTAILVDEYQDTNALQAAILEHVSQVHGNILVVGDDAQSIYAFRGAEIQNILRFEETYPRAQVFRLETNYRSTPNVLELANKVIALNVAQYPKILQPTCAPHSKPTLVWTSGEDGEAAWALERIGELASSGVKLRDIAVLFRAAHHAQALEVECVRRNIPYELRGGLRFFERAHIKNVLAFLRVYANVHDMMAWSRILKLQSGIGEVTAERMMHALTAFDKFSDVMLFDVVSEVGPRATEGWQGVQRVGEALIKAGEASVGTLIRAVLGAGYKNYLEEEYDDAEDRLEDLEQMARLAMRTHDLSRFLEEAALSESYEARRARKSRGEDRVVLSTVHQAKGLEWEAVFVVHLLQGGFPNERALKEGALEEERRLFYVAVTRAKKHLFLTVPHGDGAWDSPPSQFIEEIGKDLVEVEYAEARERRHSVDGWEGLKNGGMAG